MTATPDYEIRLVGSDFILDRWEEISTLLKSTFSGSSLSAGFTAERPADHTWKEIHEPSKSELSHVVAVSNEGRLLGAIFCVPTKRPEGVTTCDVGWFFTDTTLPGSLRMKLSGALLRCLHDALAKAGYSAIVTEMGTEDGAAYLSHRHGYVPAPTATQQNRWIRGLRTADANAISTNSEKRAWDSAGEQLARYATADIEADEVIIDLKLVLKRARHQAVDTLQLAEGFHYRSSVGRLCMNHSCGPNGYFCFDDLTYRALRAIPAGEELTFDYCTTEYELAEPFDCLCGSSQCLGRVRGFKFLSDAEKAGRSGLLSPYLRNMN